MSSSPHKACYAADVWDSGDELNGYDFNSLIHQCLGRESLVSLYWEGGIRVSYVIESQSDYEWIKELEYAGVITKLLFFAYEIPKKDDQSWQD